jgi:hypothetical protein
MNRNALRSNRRPFAARSSAASRAGVLAALALPLAATGIASAGDCLGGARAVEDQVVLRLAPGASIAAVLADAQAQFPGLSVIASIPAIRAWQIAVPEPLCESEVVDVLEDDPRILEITLNAIEESSEGQTQSFYFISIESAFSNQPVWDHIGLPIAHQLGRGAGTTVAIVDSGIDASHPVFANATILPGLSFLEGGPLDAGDGIDNDNDGATDESVGHGTHLTGVIAKMAPDAAILPIRVLDSDGLTNVFMLSQGIAAAITAGADVINVSIATESTAGILDDIVALAVAQGRIVVASAGNFGNETMQYPASLPGVFSIGSTAISDIKSAFSSYGDTLDLCAPGDAIVGPIPGGQSGPQYGSWSGTSMSAALVSGAVILAIARAESASAGLAALIATVEPLDALNPNYVGKLGFGRIDIGAAMQAIPAFLPEDLNQDGSVNSADLAILLGAWGSCKACAADLDGDGTVGAADLSLLLGAWG